MTAIPPPDRFADRHIGPRDGDIDAMLEVFGYASLDELTTAAVPAEIQSTKELDLSPATPEHDVLAELRTIASQNDVYRSYIGMGYYGCVTPPAKSPTRRCSTRVRPRQRRWRCRFE
jgi:glycine dehydrogenase